MTVPTIDPFANGTAMSAADHGAADVYANDTVLAAALGSLDISTNVYNDKSAIIFGPLRVHITAALGVLVDWVVPAIAGDATVELYDINVSALAASTGSASLDASNTVTIKVQTDSDANGSFADVGELAVEDYVSVTDALDSDADRTCAEGGTIRVKLAAYSGTPNFHAAISLLGYVSNRST